MIRPPRERRLGEVLTEALRIACEQQKIDLARQLEPLLLTHARPELRATVEQRRRWPCVVAEARAYLRALERSLRGG